MAYAYWRNGMHLKPAVFDFFFRQCPFEGEFAIFAGLADLLDFLENGFRFNDEKIEYLRSQPLKGADPEFFKWLKTVDSSPLRIYALAEGTLAFPRVPLIRAEGPIAIAQILETPLLEICNFASLMTTNARRFRMAAGMDKMLLEFGLRRAQDGTRASYYSWLGGFDGTSNVDAAKNLDILPKGTMAHSFVSSFSDHSDLNSSILRSCVDGKDRNFLEAVLKVRSELHFENTNPGELAAFIAYAQTFPSGFLALIDTYDTLNSGLPNFICVAVALNGFGYRPLGVRLDSGDLADLSKKCRQKLHEVDTEYGFYLLGGIKICASNEIDEKVLLSFEKQGHEIDVFGIGTHVVTCQNQPAFGGVYKLVEVDGKSCIKISQKRDKMSFPGRKDAHRLIGQDGKAILDLITKHIHPTSLKEKTILCCDPFDETDRIAVIPSEIIPLHTLIWDGGLTSPLPTPPEIKKRIDQEMTRLREDHLRTVNPTPYRVSLSLELYGHLQDILRRNMVVPLIK